MTPADRQRIAAEWGIDPAMIPEPTICPPRTFSPMQDGWRDLKSAAFRKARRAHSFRALAKREGRKLPKEFVL